MRTMKLLLLVIVIFSQLDVILSSKLVKLDSFPRTGKNSIDDWEFGSGFYISRNYFAQQVSVAFDLESPYQLLYDANYVDVNNWPTVPYHDYFRPQDSLSFITKNETFNLKFDSDTQQIKSTVSGIWASDTIFRLFDQDSSAYNNSAFGLIQSGDSFQDKNKIFAYTGRLGLSLNGSTISNWIIDALKEDYEGLLTFLIFDNMYYLGLGSDASKLENCDNTNSFSESVVDTSTQIGKQYWQIEADGVTFGKYSFSAPQFIRFTLSTAYFYGPQDYVQKLQDTLDAYQDGNKWIVDCEKQQKGPVIEFETSNGNLKVQPNVYILNDSKSKECYLAFNTFSDSDNTDHWAFGAIFESAYCLTLDYTNQKIQFQPAQDASDSNLTKRPSKASEFLKTLIKK